MTIDFYYTEASGPCRAVLMAAEAIGVKLNKKTLDLKNNEHLTPEFLKINPQHTVPTINDNGYALSESRAIMTYLQNQYGTNDSLYPKDAKKRAIVDQRLYFDLGTLNVKISDCYYSAIFLGLDIDPEKKQKLDDTLKILDSFLENSKFAAGDNLTLADISLVVTISTIEMFGYDLSPYNNISKWYTIVKETAPGYKKINESGIQKLKQYIAEFAKKK